MLYSEADYFAAGAVADVTHEYLNGMVYHIHWDSDLNMAGASETHVNITGNAYMSHRWYLRSSLCSAYMSDMRLKIDASDKAWFYPDVMVCCDPDDSQEKTAKYASSLIVEVFRLNAEQRWELFTFRGKECSVEFTSIDFVSSLPDLYVDVDVFM